MGARSSRGPFPDEGRAGLRLKGSADRSHAGFHRARNPACGLGPGGRIIRGMRNPVRPAIVIVTTFATVVHLAFGCGLHATCCRGTDVCCDRAEAECDSDCDCCHDGDADESPAAAVAGTTDAPPVAAWSARPAAVGCDAAGCTCRATRIERDGGPDWPAAAWIVGPPDAASTPLTRAVRDSRAGHRCPVPAELRSPLFERFLA